MSDKISKSAVASRASASRATLNRPSQERLVDESLKQKYLEVMYKDKLSLPDSLVERMATEGFELSWVRYYDVIKDRIDGHRLYEKLNEQGAQLVTPEEAPEFRDAVYKQVDAQGYGTMITRGDLALLKTPFAEADARRAAKAQRVQDITAGTISSDKPGGYTRADVQSSFQRGKR